MIKNLKTRSLSALLAGTALSIWASPAFAQSQPSSPISPIEVTDQFGVNVLNGNNNTLPDNAPAISVGVGQDAIVVSTKRTWWDTQLNAIPEFAEVHVDTAIPNTSNIIDNSATLYSGSDLNKITRYNCSGNVCASPLQDGSNITFDTGNLLKLSYTDRTGNIWKFSKDGVANAPSNNQNGIFVPGNAYSEHLDSFTQNNGKKYNITNDYATYYSTTQGIYNHLSRVASIVSSDGFIIKYAYNPNALFVEEGMGSAWSTPTNVKIFNLATTPCASDLTPCSGTPLASLQFTRSTNAAGKRSVAVTNQLGQTWVYTGVLKGSLALDSVRLPGSITDDIQYFREATTAATPWVGITRVNFRGANWTYYNPNTSTSSAIIPVTDPMGHGKQYVFDANSNPVMVTDELGRTTTFTYDPTITTRVTSVTLPEGNKVIYSYDGRGNVLSETRVPKPGSGLANTMVSATYPATCTNIKICDLPTSTTDELGRTTDYTYDPTHGGLLTITLPPPSAGAVRPQIINTYTQQFAWFKNASGSIIQSPAGQYKLSTTSRCQTLATCTGTADQIAAITVYQAGNAAQASNLFPITSLVKAGNGSLFTTTSMTYDAQGNMLTVDGPIAGSADTSRMLYDAGRRVIGVISPDPDGSGPLKPKAARKSYNTLGQQTLVERGIVNSQSDADWSAMAVTDQVATEYDSITGQKNKDIISAGGNVQTVMQYSYDADGRPSCTALRMNPAVYNALPTSACAPSTTGSFGPDRITQNIYDAVNQVIQQQSGVGSNVLSNEASYTYTANGKVASVTDANSNKTTYEFDGFDRISKTRYPSPTVAGLSSTTDYEQPYYDAAGNVTQLRLRDGNSINFTYDNLNRLSTRTPIGENSVAYAYNLLNKPTAITRAGDGMNLTYSYDTLGRLNQESQPFGSSAYQYDTAGNITRLSWSDGFFINYDYNISGNITAIRENGAISGVGVLASYSYDSLGRRSNILYGNGTSRSYAYDAASRLTGLQLSFPSSANNQLIGSIGGSGTPIAYNPASQIMSISKSNNAYAFSAGVSINRPYITNGLNQFTLSGGVQLGYDGRGNLINSGGVAYGYDMLNALKTAPGIAMGYDPMGRLIQFSASSNTQFAYSGSSLISESSGGALLRRYVPGPGTDEPIVWYEGSGTADRRFMQADERGSIVAISDASGSVIAKNAYDEFGIPQPGNAGRFGYTGQTWFSELGLYNYKARWYSPTLGRFMQADPIGYGDGMNMMNYAHSDPVNGSDPSGLDGELVVMGARVTQAAGGGCFGTGNGVVCDSITVIGKSSCSSLFSSSSCSTLSGNSALEYKSSLSFPTGPSSSFFTSGSGNYAGGSAKLTGQYGKGRTSWQCVFAAGKKNWPGLVLDVGGFLVSLVPGAKAAAAGATIGTATFGIGVTQKDAFTIGSGLTGHYLSSAAGILDITKGLASYLPVVGTAAAGFSLVADGYKALKDGGCL